MEEGSIYSTFTRFYFSLEQDNKFDGVDKSDKMQVAAMLAQSAVLTRDLGNLQRLTDLIEGHLPATIE